MGRWAQRRHGSSAGAAAGGQLNFIVAASHDGSNDIEAIYQNAIDATLFDAASFTTVPNGFIATAVTQADAAVLTISFGDDVSTDSQMTYEGTVFNVLSPQTIGVT